MLANDETALRSFCARILGWTTECEVFVERAMRSIGLAADRSAALVLLGETHLVPIAYALHRRMLGAEQPFLVADRRRASTSASVRFQASYRSGVAAVEAARGGSVCVHRHRLPRDFSAMVARLRQADVVLFVCGDRREETNPFLVRPAPVSLPSLRVRLAELPRIVDEYARDALAELRAREARPPEVSFTDEDLRWIIERCPMTLAEIEKATLRLLALKMSPRIPRAARRLGMSPVSLSRWIARRRPLPSDLEEIFDDFVLTPEERVVFERELEASFAEEEAGLLVDAADVIADLRARR